MYWLSNDIDLEGRYAHFSMENWPYLGNGDREELGYC